ncbi:hypothetical protein TNCV_2217361 [Trichonephila clavipes]|nr:hypothetical protein TNCV_2217361 [Trichonephila clavipes]
MPPRRNKEKLEQRTEFKRQMIICLREGGFSSRALGTRVQFLSWVVVAKHLARQGFYLLSEAVDNNSKNWQWTTAGDISARRSTPAPYGGE